MGTLEGRRFVVVGGTGLVGRGAVEVLMARGASVIVPSRDHDRHAPEPGVACVPADLSTPEGAATFAATLGEVDGVVASIGKWWSGPELTDTSPEDWEATLDANLGVHVRALRALLPLVADRPGGTYVIVSGDAGLAPVPTAGAMSVASAGMFMLARVADAELADRPGRVRSVSIDVSLRGDDAPIGPRDVGEAIADVLAGTRQGDATGVVHVP